MIEDASQLIECNICHCKLYNQAWEIHQIMCERNQKKKQVKKSKIIKDNKEPTLNNKQQSGKQQIIPCLECGSDIAFSQYAKHQLECEGRQYTKCVYCNINFPTYLIQEHLPVCESYKVVLECQKEEEANEQGEENQYLEVNQEEQQQEQQEYSEQYNEELAHSIGRLSLLHQKEPEPPLTKPQLNKLRTYLAQKTETCAICYTFMRKGTASTMLKCKHFYHPPCINAWLIKNPLCPMCRRHALK